MREEFNRFQEDCVEENTNTETLGRRLLSDDYADNYAVYLDQKARQKMPIISNEARREALAEALAALNPFADSTDLARPTARSGFALE